MGTKQKSPRLIEFTREQERWLVAKAQRESKARGQRISVNALVRELVQREIALDVAAKQ